MNDYPTDPHGLPLEKLFPSLKPEERETMRGFLDKYCEVAYQVFERIEYDPEACRHLDYVLWQNKAKRMVDSVQKRTSKSKS